MTVSAKWGRGALGEGRVASGLLPFGVFGLQLQSKKGVLTCSSRQISVICIGAVATLPSAAVAPQPASYTWRAALHSQPHTVSPQHMPCCLHMLSRSMSQLTAAFTPRNVDSAQGTDSPLAR